MSKLGQCLRCLGRLATRKMSTASGSGSSVKNINSLVFGKYLLHTNIISSGVLMWLGDICEQEIEYRRGKLTKRYDYGRMLRMVMPKRDLTTVTKKIALDQFVMSPLCIATFFYSMGLLEDKSVQKMNEELTAKFLDVYVMDWCVWVPTQFINFYFVPVKYQVFYINAVTMFYNVFLSYIKHKDVKYLKMGDT
ncbi:hypothetical protein GWI33_015181 [Rhynchophorus ferrugineus]|uniref:Mpv17-like protein 2 n=1 Tax=Rhynchophorus ferrugineus TaxID=354439 RepID=A0A834I478_RHYFE|nr:hypothetical protein GWI33_015181 [Rhynchophorus ferrugineus]